MSLFKISLSCWTRGIQVSLVSRDKPTCSPMLLPACIFTVSLWFYCVFREQHRLSSEQTENSVALLWVLRSPLDVFQSAPGAELPRGRSPLKDSEAHIGLWWAHSTIMELQLFCSQTGKPCHCICSVCLVNSPGWPLYGSAFCLLSSYSSLSQRLQVSCCLKTNIITMALYLKVE